jgi:hypothetical protein
MAGMVNQKFQAQAKAMSFYQSHANIIPLLPGVFGAFMQRHALVAVAI